MKISQQSFTALQAAIQNVGGLLPTATMRQRWDQLWRSRFNVNILYREGLNDDHIDTALRRIAKENEHGKERHQD